MTIKEIINKIKLILEELSYPTAVSYLTLNDKKWLKAIIKALEQEPKWIPVSERLPEENGYYLTTTMYHEVYCDFWVEDRFNRTEVVIAWMPLPKPYEPQESEKVNAESSSEC